MLKKLLLLYLLAAPAGLIADEAADNEALLQALLDNGYLEIARSFHESKGAAGLTEFGKKLVELRFAEAEVKNGKSSMAERATQLRSELVGGINKENVDAARLIVKFDYGVELLKAGEIDEGIKHLKFFARYYTKVLHATSNDGIKNQLAIKFYDVDLFLGQALFGKAGAQEDRDKKIDLLEDAFEHIGDYVWSLQAKYPEHAIKGYPDLLNIVAAMDHPDLDIAEEPLDEVIKQILSEKPVPEGWTPIWRAEGDPKSLPLIFATAIKCIELQKSDGERAKLGSSLLRRLEKEIKLNPDKTFYMRHQLNLELAKFCAYLAFDAGIKNGKTYETKGAKFVELIPNDPTKSPYAGAAAIVAERFGLDRGEVTLGDPLLLVALDHYHASRFDQARRGFENLLRHTDTGSQRRASMWFYIGLSYYKGGNFLEASLAFEKSWETHPDWTEGGFGGAKAFDMHENAAKLFSSDRKKKHPKRSKELQIADRNFQQSVRKRVFSNRRNTPQGAASLFFWSSNMLAADYIDNHLQQAYDGFSQIPQTSKFYTDSLYNMFLCSFGMYQGMNADNPARSDIFKQATDNAEALFAKTKNLDTKDPKNESLLNADAAARTTVVQLYLLEPSKAQEARDILETLESRYGNYLGETEKKRIPAWKIEARVNLGTTAALDQAMNIWDGWQKKILQENKGEPNDVLVKYTQLLANKGIKAWMSRNNKDPKFSAFQKHNTKISKWIIDNVDFTPLLLVQLALTDKKNQQWPGVAENTDLFVKSYESDASWKSDKDAKKYAPQMYLWQVEAFKKIDTESAWVRVAECYKKYNERSAHSSHRRRQADALKMAGDRAFTAGNQATGKEHYVKAAGMYRNLRRAKGSHAEYSDNWWSSYDMTFQCRNALAEYNPMTKAMVSLRLAIADSDTKRQWLLDWIDRVKPNTSGGNAAKLQLLRDNIIKDHEDALKAIEEDNGDSEEPPAEDDDEDQPEDGDNDNESNNNGN